MLACHYDSRANLKLVMPSFHMEETLDVTKSKLFLCGKGIARFGTFHIFNLQIFYNACYK